MSTDEKRLMSTDEKKSTSTDEKRLKQDEHEYDSDDSDDSVDYSSSDYGEIIYDSLDSEDYNDDDDDEEEEEEDDDNNKATGDDDGPDDKVCDSDSESGFVSEGWRVVSPAIILGQETSPGLSLAPS